MFRYCALLSLCASVGLAADFQTGQGARLVIGQTTFTSQTPGASDTLLGAVGGLAFAGDTLYVSDSNREGYTPVNNRALMFQNISQVMPRPLDPIAAYSGRCPVCVGQANVVLGQSDFLNSSFHISQNGMRTPTGIASDGRMVAVADTQNNRVLIWKSIPFFNGQPADIVLGQPNFTTVQPLVANSASFRGPQGVWIQNGKLFVADTQNNRIMIWNSIPTQNNQPADVELGQKDFNSVTPIPVADTDLAPTQNSMLTPVSVTSDGTRLYVSDLGYNRVLIWNFIPTQNNTPASVVIGQQDFVSAVANDKTRLCPAGTDSTGNPYYPDRCGKTLNYPRFALSDGKRLFVADGGNDRVLIYNNIPTQNTPQADFVLGQPDEYASVVTSTTDLFHPLLKQSAADVVPSPTSLAWDGTNLYVADPSNRRILIFTPGDNNVPINGVRNAASRETFATAEVEVAGTIQAKDTVTVTINSTAYTYTIVSADTTDTILAALESIINAGSGDPFVLASIPPELGQLLLSARQPGPDGNAINLAVSTSDNAMISIAASGSTLSGGESAGVVAPGTVVSIFGANLADSLMQADPTQPQLPIDLGGVQVYFDGIRAPLFFVSPTQINTQIPFEVADTNVQITAAGSVNVNGSVSAYVRTVHSNGTVSATTAVAVPIAQQNPGVFAVDGPDPRTAVAFHSSSYATATITVSGTIVAGDIGIVTIEDRTYTYVVQSADTLNGVRDAFIALINSNKEEKVVASPGGAFVRILLSAKIPGPEGNYPVTATSNAATSTAAAPAGGSLSLGLNQLQLCCSNVAGSQITQDNPAVPGETFYIFATGLGLISDLNGNPIPVLDGNPYHGPQPNNPNASVSSLAGTKTADVLAAGLEAGLVGVYRVVLQLNPSVPPDSFAQVTISQDIYTSNIVTIAIGNPTQPPTQ
jgi:uncharacterized protein (TIGR03437 family)